MQEISLSTSVVVQGDRGATIRIEVRGYENPRADNQDDANWLRCWLTVAVDGFSCELDASFTTHDFVEFQHELEQVISTMAGVASFQPYEEAIRLDVKLGPSGQGSVSGLARSFSTERASLSFSFETDQTFLAQTRSELNRINREFPIITVLEV